MPRREFTFVLAVGVLCSGCGGGGSASTSQPISLAGTYLGEYVDQNGNAGQLQLNVGPSGGVTGVFNTPGNVSERITGSVDTKGLGTIQYAGNSAKVQLGKVEDQSTTLSMTPTSGNGIAALAALVQTPSVDLPSGGAFAGYYSGTLTDTLTGKVSAIALVVGPSEVANGYIVSLVGNAPTSAYVRGFIASSGNINLLQGAQGSITGNLVNGVTVGGNVSLINGDPATVNLTKTGHIYAPPPKLAF